MLDLARLEKVKRAGNSIRCRCPACAEGGRDRRGEHLRIESLDGSGPYGCALHPDDREHRQRIFALAGIREERTPAPKWTAPVMRPGTYAEITWLQRLRGFPLFAGIEILHERGLLRFGEAFDDGAMVPCWFVTDSSGYNAQARRLDGRPMTLRGSGTTKAKTLHGSRASWPVGAADIGNAAAVVLVEGGPDMLAAAHFAYLELGYDHRRITFVAMLGAGQRIPEDGLASLAGKRVRIIVQADEAGIEGSRRWAEQLRATGSTVDAFSCAGLTKPDGTPAKDLADLARWPVEAWVPQSEVEHDSAEHGSEGPTLGPASPSYRRIFQGLLP